MMMKRKLSLFMMILGVAFLISCDMLSGDKTGFETTDSGLQYRLVDVNDDAPAPVNGDILSLVLTYSVDDSVLFNTDMIPEKNMKLQMQDTAYAGDLYEMLGMMHLGDSAVFMLDAESFMTKTAGAPTVPPIMQDKMLTFNLKLINIQTEQEMQDEMMANAQKRMVEEAELLKTYVAENNYDVEPTESGLYVIVTEQGSGPKPKQGDKVKVHYTGTLLDGSKFDSSLDRGQPFEFNIGGRVIGGWNEGIALLNVGSKAKLIVPSHLGYGERGAGQDIPPNSPLIFDVELIDIVKE